MSLLEAHELVVRRDGREVARVDELAVEAGETLAILGPNGAGKSSLVLGLAGLLPVEGTLRYRGAPLDGAYRRAATVVFQRPLLLDRTVRENAALGLELRGVPRAERLVRADTALARFGIAHLAGRRATGLSGGEAQRVSLARALAIEPALLFLDEPFAALDPPSRDAILGDLAQALAGHGTSTVLVTHDRDEALSLADRVAVLIAGRLRQCGPAEEVFARPADAEVAAFVGVDNVLPARVEESTDELTVLRIGSVRVEVTALPPDDLFPLLCVRPDDVTISRAAAQATSARNSFAGRIVRVEPLGRRVRISVDCGFPLIAHVTRQSARELGLAPGNEVVASFKATVPHLLPRRRRSVPSTL